MILSTRARPGLRTGTAFTVLGAMRSRTTALSSPGTPSRGSRCRVLVRPRPRRSSSPSTLAPSGPTGLTCIPGSWSPSYVITRSFPPNRGPGHVSKMPLPDLMPSVDSGRRHQAAFLDELYLVSPDDLAAENRVACLSQAGVNLLLQRWVHHNSRVVVPTVTYQEVTSPAYEEADLIEYWCEERIGAGLGVRDASVEAIKWLREESSGGVTRQMMLEDPQRRSSVRRDMHAALRKLRAT